MAIANEARQRFNCCKIFTVKKCKFVRDGITENNRIKGKAREKVGSLLKIFDRKQNTSIVC